MAITFRFDRVRGNTGRKTINGWDSLIRMVVVSGLTSVNGYERIHQAVLTLFTQEGIQIGTPHPAEPTAFLRSITPESLDPKILVLRLEYKVSPNRVSNISLGGSVTQVQNNVDVNNDRVLLTYTYDDDYPEQERAGTSESTGVIMNKLRRTIGVSINRQEQFALDGVTPITHVILLDRSKLYQGKINNAVWNVDPNGAVGTWMCQSIVANTIDGGFSYQVVYKFQYRFPDWKEHVVFIDPNTDKPAKDLDAASDKMIQQYEGINFNALLL